MSAPATSGVFRCPGVVKGILSYIKLRVLPDGTKLTVTKALGLAIQRIDPSAIIGISSHIIDFFMGCTFTVNPTLNDLYAL